MTQKIEKLKEVSENLTTLLNGLELYIFTQDIGRCLTENVETQETITVDEPK